MRSNILFTAVSMALTAAAMPSSFIIQQQDLVAEPLATLPESGRIVSTPLAFEAADDEFTFYVDFSGEMDGTMLDDWKNLVVNSHNKFRSHYGAQNVAWSDALYPGTLQWAQQCKFQHRSLEFCARGQSEILTFSISVKAMESTVRTWQPAPATHMASIMVFKTG